MSTVQYFCKLLCTMCTSKYLSPKCNPSKHVHWKHVTCESHLYIRNTNMVQSSPMVGGVYDVEEMWNAPQILGVEEILGVESIEKGWAQLIKGWRGSCWVAPQCFTLPRPTPPAPFYHNQIYLTLAPVHNPIYATDQQGQWIARLLLRTPIIQPATAPHSNPPDTKTGKNEKVKKQKQSDQGQIIAIKPYFLFQVLKI